MSALTRKSAQRGSTGTISREKAPPLTLWAAKPLIRIYKDTLPSDDAVGQSLEISCARNEAEGCMFGVRGSASIHNLRLEAADLVSERGIVPKSSLKLGFVGCVPVPRNTSDTPLEELERLAPFDAPDPILDLERVDLEVDETQPCHFLVHVPNEAEPGDYHGHIKVSSSEAEALLPVLLHVYPIALPDLRSLYVTNWFSLDKISSAHKADLWSQEFWKALESWIALMAEYRQNVFWVPLDTVRIFAKGGNYRFDFSVFDRYVKLLRKHKADRIEIMHVARYTQWGGNEIALREFKVSSSAGDVQTENGAKILPHLLPALEKHLEDKGWLDKSMIHVADEPTEDGLKAWLDLSKVVHEYAPKIKRIDAIETVGFEDHLEVWVPTLHHFNDWMDHYLKAAEEGYEVWFYTCLNPKGRYPNRFLDYPLFETRILHWINYAYGLKGFLHWGFNWWRNDPFGEPDPSLPPGDTHIAYPGKKGPTPSLRLEAMRDGLEDYEYLRLLEDEIVKIKRKLEGSAPSLPFERRALEICRKAVPSIAGHVRDPAVLMETRESIVNEIIDLRRRPLALVLTEPPEWKPVEKGSTTIIVKGICEKGSHLDVNGKHVNPDDGYFSTYTYPGKGGEVVTRIMKDGLEKVIARRFKVVS